MDDEDLVITILGGLSPNFREISTCIRTRETTMTYEDIHEKLVDFETELKHGEVTNTTLLSVNYVQRGRNNSQRTSNRGRGYKGNNFDPNYNRNKQNVRKPNEQAGDRRPICQLCGKTGHVAKRCWNYTVSQIQGHEANQVHNSTSPQNQS